VYNMRMARVKERWDFRVEPETDRLVRQAAATSQRENPGLEKLFSQPSVFSGA
jgi:uncharacterized protein (DUF1778 family)